MKTSPRPRPLLRLVNGRGRILLRPVDHGYFLLVWHTATGKQSRVFPSVTAGQKFAATLGYQYRPHRPRTMEKKERMP